jgi:hypothetical protein
MLRRVVQLAGLAMALTGAWLLSVGAARAGAQALGVGALLFLAVSLERWRDRARQSPPGPAFRPTGERFEDPGSGRTMEVHYNPQTGERHYKPEDN